jgi:hypothetical protein
VTDLRRYLGQTIDLLSTDSIQVLSAAMEELKRVGKSPAYDYAGVTMKLCKAFERELKHQLFDAWCQEVRSKIGERGVKQLRIDSESYGNDRTGDTALDLLAKKRKPELGGMRFMLRAVANGSEHPAIKVLKSFLESFEGHDWLISTDHDQALERISSRYRNGGVHEHLVNHDLCSEATDYILSGKDAVLPKLLRSLVKRR